MTATATPPATYRAPVPTGGDGFGRLLRSEWTKLKSVRRWVIGLFIVGALTILGSVLGAGGNSTTANDDTPPLGPDGRPVFDEGHFVHQSLTGDGSITAQVASQANSQGWARAGLMMKERPEAGAPFASIAVTPEHGVWFHANFSTYETGSESQAPRWLRLTRAGTTITGYESADGAQWSEVGSIELDGLPETVQVGMFVNSPGRWEVERNFGSTSVGPVQTIGTATFDSVAAEPALPGPWQDTNVVPEFAEERPADGFTEVDGAFTVEGTGGIASESPGDRVTELALSGIQFGQIAVVALAVLFITAEFKRGMIRTTFATSPRRGRVLAAKAIVIGSVIFVIGLVGTVASFYLAQPTLRSNGFVAPTYPAPSLFDGPALRAVIGSAAYLALIAVLSLGVGAILRRSAGAIAAMLVTLMLPFILYNGLPLTVAEWLVRTTPFAGLAIQRTSEPNVFDPDPQIEPFQAINQWVGLGVLAAWAAAALAFAIWRLRRRDA
jgi:ABC-type transport system involved in multi-copper enzyme maturation permease subunit/regulation of enolase protein 1 (concanavalin A-like superfamily)